MKADWYKKVVVTGMMVALLGLSACATSSSPAQLNVAYAGQEPTPVPHTWNRSIMYNSGFNF